MAMPDLTAVNANALSAPAARRSQPPGTSASHCSADSAGGLTELTVAAVASSTVEQSVGVAAVGARQNGMDSTEEGIRAAAAARLRFDDERVAASCTTSPATPSSRLLGL